MYHTWYKEVNDWAEITIYTLCKLYLLYSGGFKKIKTVYTLRKENLLIPV